MLIKSEQQLDILSNFSTSKISKINAGSGCAKTTTLTMIAEENDQRSLYIAYNKAMADEASHKFPPTVDCKTTHALAFGITGSALKHKLERPKGAYVNVCGTGKEVAMYFNIRHSSFRVSPAMVGHLILETVNRFEYSADERIGFEHVPSQSLDVLKKIMVENKVSNTVIERELKNMKHKAVSCAKELWAMRIDTNSPIKCTHDTYLKLFQMRKIKLTNYQVIYLDEAQDTNDCVLDIIENQNCKIVLVGDEFQSIYQWRGSVNAMSKVDADYTGVLTKSYRFGQEIADIANVILNGVFKIQGNEDKTSKVGRSRTVDRKKPFTYLFRTNFAMLETALEIISRGIPVNIKINMQEMVRKLESARHLFDGELNKVSHPDILVYTCWEELQMDTHNNSELARVRRIVEKDEYHSIINTLKNYKPSGNAHVTMCTAHSAKGLEWDQVILANDFPTAMKEIDSIPTYIGLCEQERNLLYVAATRAKVNLEYNDTVVNIMENQ